MRKYLASILAVVLVCLTLTSCGGTGNNDVTTKTEKWVLVNEEQRNSKDTLVYSYDYEYDETGRLIGERGENFVMGERYSCSDFKYDKNGNVTYKTKTYDSGSDADINHYSYTYDGNGNCITEEIESTYANYKTTYKYDERGNIIERDYIAQPKETSSYQYVDTYVLTYENNLCVESKITIKSYGDFVDNSDTYAFKRFEYDSNGNKVKECYYGDATIGDNAGEVLEIDGNYYSLYNVTNYTWEKLIIVGNDNNANDDNTVSTTSTTTTTTTTTTTAPARDLYNYGFYDMETNGDHWLKIEAYDFSEGYVVVCGGQDLAFVNGNFVSKSFPRSVWDGEANVNYDSYTSIFKDVDSVGSYNIVSNDILSVNIPGDYTEPMQISERVVSDKYDTIVLKTNWAWYILESSIDSDRPMEFYERDKFDMNHFKLYLK